MSIPFASTFEKLVNDNMIIFTLVVLYQSFFGKFTRMNVPEKATRLFDNSIMRLLTLVAIAFIPSKDVETAVLSVVLFLGVIYALKSPEERKNDGLL